MCRGPVVGLQEGQCGGAERVSKGSMAGVETAKSAGLQGQASMGTLKAL